MKRIQDVEKKEISIPPNVNILLPGACSYGGEISDCYINISEVIGKITEYIENVVQESAGTGTVTYDEDSKLKNSGKTITKIFLPNEVGPEGSQSKLTVSSSEITNTGILRLKTPTQHYLDFHPTTDSKKTFEIKTGENNDFSVISGVGLLPKIWNIGLSEDYNILKSYLSDTTIPEGTIIFATWVYEKINQFSMYIKLKEFSTSNNYIWYQIKAAGAMSKNIS